MRGCGAGQLATLAALPDPALWLSVAAVALAAAFLPVIDIAEMLSPWQYIAVAPLTALITFVAAGRKGGAASCA